MTYIIILQLMLYISYSMNVLGIVAVDIWLHTIQKMVSYVLMMPKRKRLLKLIDKT